MKHSCQYCKKGTSITNVDFDWYLFVCPQCGKYTVNTEKEVPTEYYRDLRQNMKIRDKRIGLFLGNRSLIDGKEYSVVGVIQKRQEQNYKWFEYILKSFDGKTKFLSESNGNWVILEEFETYEKLKEFSKKKMDVEADTDYKTFYSFEPVVIQGFFDFNPFLSGTLNEVADPPYLFSKETYRLSKKEVESFYFGNHVSRRQIKKWFPNAWIPTKNGVGIVQPPICNFKQMAYIFLCVAVLLLGLNFWYYRNDVKSAEIYSASLEFSKGKDFNSPSFALNGRTGTLQFDFYSPVDNNWASCDIALVNENNGDRKYLSKDIEYYSGIDGGESWVEGSRSARAYVCGVTPDKYHIEFSVMHDTTKISSTFSMNSVLDSSVQNKDPLADSYIQTTVGWKKPSLWNLNFILIILLVILVVAFLIDQQLEYARKKENFE